MTALSIPTYNLDGTDVTARNGEYTGTPLTDTTGNGTYSSYLGMNRAGSNAPGIGITTGGLQQTAAEIAAGDVRYNNWTEEDQHEAARIPQDSQHLGGTGYVNRATTDWPSSGGVEGVGDVPVQFIIQPASAPGTVDVNDTANLVVTDTAAADGAVMDTVSGAVNQTGATVGIGDLVWGNVPVA
jgi:hypothetical protein